MPRRYGTGSTVARGTAWRVLPMCSKRTTGSLLLDTYTVLLFVRNQFGRIDRQGRRAAQPCWTCSSTTVSKEEGAKMLFCGRQRVSLAHACLLPRK